MEAGATGVPGVPAPWPVAGVPRSGTGTATTQLLSMVGIPALSHHGVNSPVQHSAVLVEFSVFSSCFYLYVFVIHCFACVRTGATHVSKQLERTRQRACFHLWQKNIPPTLTWQVVVLYSSEWRLEWLGALDLLLCDLWNWNSDQNPDLH